jgi:hypothetical protein
VRIPGKELSVTFQSVTMMAVAMSAVTKVPVLIRVKISMYVDVMLGGKTVEVEFVRIVLHLLDVLQNIQKKGLVVMKVVSKNQTHVFAQKDGQDLRVILLNV